MRKTLGGGKRFAFAAGGPMRTAVLRGRQSYADGGPARTAPEGLVPLDSHSSPAGGTGELRGHPSEHVQ